jgi:hypothetical protein
MSDTADPEEKFGTYGLAGISVLAERELEADGGDPRPGRGDEVGVIAGRHSDVDGELDANVS